MLLNKLQIKDVFNTNYEHYALIELSSSRQNENLMLRMQFQLQLKMGVLLMPLLLQMKLNLLSFGICVSHRLLKNNGDFITLSVSISLLPSLIEKTGHLITFVKIPYIFGHVSIHYYLFKPEELALNDFLSLKDEIKKSLYDITNELDGSHSAEHGIGLAKKEELKKYRNQNLN